MRTRDRVGLVFSREHPKWAHRGVDIVRVYPGDAFKVCRAVRGDP